MVYLQHVMAPHIAILDDYLSTQQLRHVLEQLMCSGGVAVLCQSRRGIRLQGCLKVLKESGLAQALLTHLQSEGVWVLGFRINLYCLCANLQSEQLSEHCASILYIGTGLLCTQQLSSQLALTWSFTPSEEQASSFSDTLACVGVACWWETTRGCDGYVFSAKEKT